MDLCSVLWMRADLLKENELVRRIRPACIAMHLGNFIGVSVF